MRRIFFMLLLVSIFAQNTFAKKDKDAWKKELTLEQQYATFKENLNFWNGSYFTSPERLDEFHQALNDSILVLEQIKTQYLAQIGSLQSELQLNSEKTRQIQENLDESIKRQNSINVFGFWMNKNVYSVSMYIIILGVLALCAIVFMMFKRSYVVTMRTKKEYDELKNEFEVHKKNALDRYTKMNMELHQTRLELNKR